MVGVHGTASTIFTTVRDAGVNVIMISQASSEHSVCFAVKSSEADAAVESLSERCAGCQACKQQQRYSSLPQGSPAQSELGSHLTGSHHPAALRMASRCWCSHRMLMAMLLFAAFAPPSQDATLLLLTTRQVF